MKKVILGVLFSALLLSGCSGQNGQAGGSNDSDLQDTVDSLTTENSKLKSENSELSERIANFENLFEGTSATQEDGSSSSSTSSFKYGEPADFTTNERITVTEVKADDSVSLNDPKDGEHPVIITAIVENTSNEPIDFNAQTFDLYDGNSELATFDASTYSNNIPNSIAGGKKATVVMHFSSKGNAPYSVTYGPATWDE